ncbi:hypothetical protein K1T71_015154 [Dendrolimus kikuchii]|nr:hypothetical protein K1T71_015154 [Dendrolimus kikuchii]
MYVFSVLLFFCIFFYVTLVYNKDEGSDRGAHSDRGALWFGPRLGKRSLKMATEDNRPYLRLLEAADALKFYYDQLPFYESQADEPETRVTKKVIFTPKIGRSLSSYQDRSYYDNVEFTPRLGRRMTAETASAPAEQEYYNAQPEAISSRNRLFSPRLGRTIFSPRLGREISYDSYPDRVRVARSTNKTGSN